LDLSIYLTQLARILAEQGKLAEAREAAQQAVDICKQHPGQVYPTIETNAAVELRYVVSQLAGDGGQLHQPAVPPEIQMPNGFVE
jgi:hypothetical protein